MVHVHAPACACVHMCVCVCVCVCARACVRACKRHTPECTRLYINESTTHLKTRDDHLHSDALLSAVPLQVLRV